MNTNRAEAVELAAAIAAGAASCERLDVAVCPPAVYLDAVAAVIGKSPVGLGAQNMYFEASGAFTGELSGGMLADIGCQYVILGHSERRWILGETDADVHRKVTAAFAAGLAPIVCVGETLEQREAGNTADVISQQFHGSLAAHPVDLMPRLVVAYEPVWAIGTGRVATTEQAEEVHAHLRELLKNEYNSQIADTVRIQYGGSVKPDNAAELLSQPNIDGALVGGASLAADSFLAILAVA
jgi:triosephosphate isomerase